MTSSLIWILIASLLGFAIAAVFAGWLRLQRNLYLLFYILPVTALVIVFFISNNLNIKEIILHNLGWGLLGAFLVCAILVKNVLSQPSSERHKGIALISDIFWPGFAYGLIDALLLSVLPILAVRLAIEDTTMLNSWSGKILFIVLGLLASFFATTVYHLGYPEFLGKKVIVANIGNGLMSLAYLLTLNPLAAILPHITMHIVAMIHGPRTTLQVPPHYDD